MGLLLLVGPRQGAAAGASLLKDLEGDCPESFSGSFML